MKASDMLPSSDLSQVVQIAREYNVEPELLLAIGWHETQWGRLGDGQYGMYMGYGSYDSGSDYSFAGLVNQVKGAAAKMAAWGQTVGNVSLTGLSMGNSGVLPTGLYASDQTWANSIWKYYNQIDLDLDRSGSMGDFKQLDNASQNQYIPTRSGTVGSTGFLKQVGFLLFSGLIAIGLVYGGVK